MHKFSRLDHRYVWHPFTQMNDWLKREPVVIASGKGAVLYDTYGREYLDANSSIWTNLHGHNHPKINAAIQQQLRKIAHSSALGLANEPASLLAEKVVALADPTLGGPEPWRVRIPARAGDKMKSGLRSERGYQPGPRLSKVFFSDDGSTAMEVALKLAYEYARRIGRSTHPRFLTLERAYHGDTLGAVSLGHIDLFHAPFRGLILKSDAVMAPYCYRCPFNRAKPERADAREYRKCHWECVDKVEQTFSSQRKKGNPYAAVVVEPWIQGAAGMIPQPAGWLRRVAEIARGNRAQLIADEVMTGFGRTGFVGTELRRLTSSDKPRSRKGQNDEPPCGFHSSNLFACHQEGVQPDYLALAKGLTGGYLPMAATLTTQAVFDAFLGEYNEFKTFFHGHSFTANQLGAAAALASLDILQSPASIRARRQVEHTLREELQELWSLPNIGDIRQVGLIAGIELIKRWSSRTPFELRERVGIRVCEAMARRGVLTRPIGNVIVLMPPYCTSAKQVRQIVSAVAESVEEVLSVNSPSA